MITTRAEAITLEDNIDNLLRAIIDYNDVQISLALSGKIKVDFGDNYICFTRNYYEPNYLRFTGDYVYLNSTIKNIQKVFKDNSESITLLMESYDNISKLV